MAGNGLELSWDRCAAGEWRSLLASAGLSSLEQSWAYGEALAKVERCRVRRAVITRRGEALALVQAFEKPSYLPVVPVRIVRGPVWIGPDLGPALRQDVLRAIKGRFPLTRRNLLIWSPELPAAPESRALMRACGMRQMVTGYSTALLDLGNPVEALRAGLHGKWRNALVAGEKAGLTVRCSAAGRDFDWLLDRCDSQRRQQGYVGPSGDLVRAMTAAEGGADMLLLTAALGPEPLAGVLFLRHGGTATYLLAWSGPKGRARRAHNLLLWRAVLALRERDVRWLDLGGVNAAAPGIARFKLGLRGRLNILIGTWI